MGVARGDVQAEARWPAWTVPAAIVTGGAAGQLAAVLVILPLAAVGAGDGDVTGAGLLLSSVAFGAALLGSIALLVRSSDPLTARRLGLRPTAIAPALAWTALGGALVAAFVFFVAQITALSDLFAVPPELDGRTALAERMGIGAAPERAGLGIGVVASAVGRVVVPAVLAEVVLRGFALHALARWRGDWPALAITGVLTTAPVGFALGGPEGATALLPIALLLGVVLGLLYLLTHSLLPGIALSAAVMGAGYGGSLGWSAPAIVLLSAACCIAALALAAAVVVRDRPRSRY